eukprot:TRINITY_DN5747_c0_g2_i2.p1 TRINITY_DN5747_c0_g2~~TRINITY_DN5747_c0_g2_i2.p1  ORF type:complete len:156 (+),score=42.54 TRINITY_DN5747_c0_g2_i2:54-470(+)
MKAVPPNVCNYSGLDYRVSQSGIEHMAPYMTKRVIEIPKTDFLALLMNNIQFCSFSPPVKDSLLKIDVGPVVFKIITTFGFTYCVGLRFQGSCGLLIKGKEKKALAAFLSSDPEEEVQLKQLQGSVDTTEAREKRDTF